MKNPYLAWLLLLLPPLAPGARADLPPGPGSHSVEHKTYVLGTLDFPDYHIVLGGIDMGGGGYEAIPAGEAMTWYHMASPRICAISKQVEDALDHSRWQMQLHPEALCTEEPLPQDHHVPDSNPVYKRWTTWRVTEVGPQGIQVVLVEDRKEGLLGGLMGLVATGAGALALVGFGVFAWRRRRVKDPSASPPEPRPSEGTPPGDPPGAC